MQQENFIGQYFDKYFTCDKQEKKIEESTERTNKYLLTRNNVRKMEN